MSCVDGIYCRVEMNPANFYIILTHRLFIIQITSSKHGWKDATSGSAPMGKSESKDKSLHKLLKHMVSISETLWTKNSNIN